MTEITSLPLGQSFGSRLLGVSVDRLLSDQKLVEETKELLYERLLLTIHAPGLSFTQLEDFAGRFGALAVCLNPSIAVPNHPMIATIGNLGGDQQQSALSVNDRMEWHFDYAQTAVPALVGALYAQVTPSIGGDTIFADTRSAYEDLSADERDRLDEVQLEYTMPSSLAKLLDTPQIESVVHPLVQVHPVTGRKALLVAPDIIVGADVSVMNAVSDAVAHSTQAKYLLRYRWTTGDLVVFDNRSLIHTATTYDSREGDRLLYRATVLPVAAPEPSE